MGVDEALQALGRASREARSRTREVDMSAVAVGRRLRRVSQLGVLCRYLMRMKSKAEGPPAREESVEPESAAADDVP